LELVQSSGRFIAGASVYAASKHAVEGLTKSAALEAAKSGVRVNAVAPGPTNTGMLDRFTGSEENKAWLASGVPLSRVADPQEMADIVWVEPTLIAEIEFRAWTADGKLRHASYKGLQERQDNADVYKLD
jgi:NAD(P)-dependent dehydrogenase (short-subunit alcohol dehydrogenase family)